MDGYIVHVRYKDGLGPSGFVRAFSADTGAIAIDGPPNDATFTADEVAMIESRLGPDRIANVTSVEALGKFLAKAIALANYWIW